MSGEIIKNILTHVFLSFLHLIFYILKQQMNLLSIVFHLQNKLIYSHLDNNYTIIMKNNLGKDCTISTKILNCSMSNYSSLIYSSKKISY